MAETPTPGLGRAIAVRRTELALKRRELADRAELSYPYISEIENSLKEPSAAAFRRIAEALESEPALLLAQATHYADEPPATHAAHWQSVTAPTPEPSLNQHWASPGSRRGLRPTNWAPTPDELEELVRTLVRRELDVWATYRLPELIREELRRITDAQDSTG
jgi:transcriptional regulator with XRE-family HTH domain